MGLATDLRSGLECLHVHRRLLRHGCRCLRRSGLQLLPVDGPCAGLACYEPSARSASHCDHVEDKVAASRDVRVLQPAAHGEEAAGREREETAAQGPHGVGPPVHAASSLWAALPVDQHEDRGEAEGESNLGDALPQGDRKVSPSAKSVRVCKQAVCREWQRHQDRQPHPRAEAPMGTKALDAPRIDQHLGQEDGDGSAHLQAAEHLGPSGEAVQTAWQGEDENGRLQSGR
mmetsp:Transcript_18875/g.39264  ORF Transcript_18875/g.39264 Transcript_18875/m.39264 type:complete len:231 (+) Transcript_18875:180-872(+)